MKKLLCWLALLAALTCLVFIAVDERVIIRRYTIDHDKVSSPIRLAVLTDLHGDDYGPGNSQLLRMLTDENPDAILLVGDMFSPDDHPEDELTLFRAMAEIAPCFYVTGNHEHWECDIPSLLAGIQDAGVTVLDQTCAMLAANGQSIRLCGISDPDSGIPPAEALAAVSAAIPDDSFTILLAHRPELFEQYAALGGFDLVLCGHAHGGQVRIPFLINGLYVPNQGLFPKYAGGRYDLDDTVMIISRGLVYSRPPIIPRVFNRPELVLVTIR